jgi:hypothetical protein
MSAGMRTIEVRRALRLQSVVSGAYRVLSIDRTTAPAGSEGTDWIKYRVGLGENVITGFRRGKAWIVAHEIDKVVDDLNGRRVAGTKEDDRR